MGTVNFAVVASTHPGVANTIHTQLSEPTTSKLGKRGLFSSIKQAVEKAAETVKDDVEDAATKVKDAVQTAANTVKIGVEDGAHDIKDGIKDGVKCACVAHKRWCYSLTEHPGLEDHTRFNAQHDFHTPPIKIDKNGTVFKSAVACGPVAMGIDIEMNLQASASIDFSIAITGSIVPPKFTEFKVVPCTWFPLHCVNTWMYSV